MKNVIIVLVSLFCMYSCSTIDDIKMNEQSYTVKLDSMNNSNIMSEFGIAHNIVLEDVLKDQSFSNREKRSVASKEQELKKTVFKHLARYTRTTRGLLEKTDMDSLRYDSVYEKSQSMIKGKSIEEISLTSGFVNDSISLEQKFYLSELEKITRDEDSDVNSLLSRIEKVENSALENLPVEQQKLILLATSVAANSYSFWYQYASKQKQTRASVKINWKSAGKSDIAGAVGAAVGCGIARFFGPVGWKVWAGAIVGGAVGNSATDLTMQVLDQVWK